MRIPVSFALLALCITLICSCGKGSPVAPEPGGGGNGNPNHNLNNDDTTAPVLQILSPVDMQAYSSGSAIQVKGKITDDLGLYQGRIRILNDANGSVLKEQLYEIHGTVAYNFDISYVATVTAASQYTVSVFFEDHGLNTVTKSVKVKVNP